MDSIGDSFAGNTGFASKGDWFELMTSAHDSVEAFASTGDCLELIASKGRRFCDFNGRLNFPARLIKLAGNSGTTSLYLE